MLWICFSPRAISVFIPAINPEHSLEKHNRNLICAAQANQALEFKNIEEILSSFPRIIKFKNFNSIF